MTKTSRHRGSALRSSLVGWAAHLGTRRGASQARLLLVVLVISVLSSTLVTSLRVVSTATESRAVSGAMESTTVAERQIRVSISDPTISYAEARRTVPTVLGDLLQGTAEITQSDMALSTMLRVDRQDALFALAYLGELDDLGDQVHLVAGSWPTEDDSRTSTRTIDVALPEAGLAPLRVKLGDTFSTRLSRTESIELHIVGVYSAPDSASLYWQPDVLAGAAHDPRYPVPGTAGALLTDAVGPLVVAPGALDVSGVPLNRIVVRADPNFSDLTIDTLIPVTNRFATASRDVPVAIGDVGGGVFYTSNLSQVFASVATALTNTRSTVVLVSLLLLVLAVVAVAQTARLMVDARAGERSLLRARGSTVSQLIWPSLLETLVIVVITAGLSPVLARLVYQLIAAQPALVAAGVPADPGLGLTSWVIAAISALIFGVVLLLPLLRREGTFHEGEQDRARQRRSSGIQRSGIDLAVLALAGVAYWQLLSYRTAVGDGATLSIDPVIAGAPALVLLAGGLLSVRFVPFAAAFAERLATGGRGIVAALAAWEVSRRAQRATAALLLLTLALAVGTFSLSYLATWEDSQHDQARMAIGAPVRVTAEGTSALEVGAELPSGYTGSPAPTLRRAATLAAAESSFSGLRTQTGPDITLLATSAGGREMIDRGRLGEEGGSRIAAVLPAAAGSGIGVPLGDGVGGMSATVEVRSQVPDLAVRVIVRAVVEDPRGVLSTVGLGTISMNDERVMSGALAPEITGELQLVGVQLVIYADELLNGQSANPISGAVFRLGDLAVFDRAPDATGARATAVAVDPELQWFTSSDVFSEGLAKAAFTPETAQLGVRFTVRSNIRSTTASFTAFTWQPVSSLPSVFTRDLADTMRADEGKRYTLVLGDADVPIEIDAVVTRIPGGGATTTYNPLTLGETVATTTANTIMVDQGQLARVLAQSGTDGSGVSEWWLDVPDSASAAYVDALDEAGLDGQSGAVLGSSVAQHPVRVATQGAIWLVAIGAALIAALGFAIYATGSLRARNAEFAQLRAVGLSSRSLVGIVAVETTLLGLLGSIFGLALGVALSLLVVPIVGVSANGAPPVPDVRINIPWNQLALLGLEVGLVLAVVVVVAARVQRDIDPTSVLRRGD